MDGRTDRQAQKTRLSLTNFQNGKYSRFNVFECCREIMYKNNIRHENAVKKKKKKRMNYTNPNSEQTNARKNGRKSVVDRNL